MLKNFLLVGLGGAAGSMLRYGAGLLVKYCGWGGEWATWAVNFLGSLLIGILWAWCPSGSRNLLWVVGLCGGFTTFSTFSLQSVSLLADGKTFWAILYLLGHVLLCLAATWIGLGMGQKICSMGD